MGKDKIDPEDNEDIIPEENEPLTYEQQLAFISVIAKPIANKKLTKKLYKLIRRASELKSIRHGLRDVQSSIRKGETGIVVFAGDVTPIEIMCHMPAVCEEKGIDYAYTPSKSEIGLAMGVRRNCLMILIKEHSDYAEQYSDCKNRMKNAFKEAFLN
ncbi:hypothetical protein CDAR_473691 [Caerostris darwini]|uniref:H/ACA ribonucleoprotein complex subunit 2 n=1 Tax=Caerostris darwini TaxID=1538125 RepID=A0AAV4SAP1_9ARAC|nr:hypothetical protein CDAR_473691 [Caerostris darwini]